MKVPLYLNRTFSDGVLMPLFVAYHRVSDRKQGRSGLGLEAQDAAISQYLASVPDAQVVGAFVEVERGGKKNRPQLSAALDCCRRHKATLVIAKLDRLARNVAFIASLMEGQIRFICCDMPDVNELTIHIFAAVAQWESRQISSRTREAMAAAKRRGAVFGQSAQKRAVENRASADAFARSLAAPIAALQTQGYKSVRALASEMNRQGIATAQGKRWHGATVFHLLKRIQRIIQET
jgi:DNA invertase Pin-like site-specific DNA recombinase